MNTLCVLSATLELMGSEKCVRLFGDVSRLRTGR